VCIKVPEDDRKQYAAHSGYAYDAESVAAEVFAAPGPKWGVYKGTQPLVVGGFLPKRPGVYSTWFLADPEVWGHGKEISELSTNVMQEALKDFAHRIETYCLAERIGAQRWYERLGMKREAELCKFGANQEDFVLYTMVRG
jgi:hypothetical protein